MSDRECRDLNRGLVRNSPKKNKVYVKNGYIFGQKAVCENENRENKPILSHESTFQKQKVQKPFQNKWFNEQVSTHSTQTTDCQMSSNKSSLSHLLQSNLTPCALEMQFERSSLEESEIEYEKHSQQNYDYDQKDWKQVKDKEYDYEKSNTDHPVYRTISLINGTINRMDLGEMKTRCKELKLDCNGKREAVKRRLKEYYKTEKLIQAGLLERKSSDERNSDFFIVIDFEATCEEKNPSGYPHEIIEFPAVLVSSREKTIVDVFHSFVRPTINPKLSEFCHNLTGISQATVDDADTFEVVHERFTDWMSKHQLGTRYTFTMVTDGPFDMGRFLYLQTRHIKMPFPYSYASTWANLRKCFANFYKGDFYKGSSGNNSANRLPGLQTMLDMLGLEFQGNPHSGVDDARNIARILMRLLSDRAFVRVNEKIVINHSSKAEDDNRSAARLANVIPVARREAERWFRAQKKSVENNDTQDNAENQEKYAG